MRRKKLHVSEDGILRRCRATKEPCRLEHYASEKEAEAAIAEHMEGETLKALTKDHLKGAESSSDSIVDTDGSIDEDMSPEAVPDTISADNSYTYAIFQLQADFFHDNSEIGGDPELFYYSSPAGRLDLRRRANQSASFDNPYTKIQETIDADGFEPKSPEIDEKAFNTLAGLGEERIRKDFTGFQQRVGNDPDSMSPDEKETYSAVMKERKEVGAYLIKKSHEWLSRLSSEEQEAVAYNTSRGSFLAAYSAGVGDENISSNAHFAAEELARKEGMYVEDFADVHRKRLISSCKKAPLLEDPVNVYRGVSEHSLVGLVEADGSGDELYQMMVNNEFAGREIYAGSSMQKIPQSATASPDTAFKFSGKGGNKRVVFKMKQSTIASPVSVSSLGYGESEIFTNPNSTYRINGSYVDNDTDVLIVDMEEIPNRG